MDEAQRILRYAIPGSVTIALFAGWIFMEMQTCACLHGPPLDPGATAALLAAATLPVGFIAAQVASLGGWWTRRWWLTRPDSRAILAAAGCDVPPDDDDGRHRAAAEADVELHLRGGFSDTAPALRRARSLLDLMQALGNGSAAAVVGGLCVLSGLTALVVLSGDASCRRLAVGGLWLLFSTGIAWLMAVSHRRVARIAQFYLEAFVRSVPEHAKRAKE